MISSKWPSASKKLSCLLPAQPGKDYTYRDLFNLATPFAFEQWKKDVLEIPSGKGWEEANNRQWRPVSRAKLAARVSHDARCGDGR
jgi:hypothetical protein